jgi:hypothetical protein
LNTFLSCTGFFFFSVYMRPCRFGK